MKILKRLKDKKAEFDDFYLSKVLMNVLALTDKFFNTKFGKEQLSILGDLISSYAVCDEFELEDRVLTDREKAVLTKMYVEGRSPNSFVCAQLKKKFTLVVIGDREPLVLRGHMDIDSLKESMLSGTCTALELFRAIQSIKKRELLKIYAIKCVLPDLIVDGKVVEAIDLSIEQVPSFMDLLETGVIKMVGGSEITIPCSAKDRLLYTTREKNKLEKVVDSCILFGLAFFAIMFILAVL